MFNFTEFKNSKQFFGSVLTLSVIISAVVGGVFGYYGANIKSNFSDAVLNSKTGNSLTPSAGSAVKKLFDEESVIINLVKNVSPAVVSIVVSQEVKVSQSAGSPFDVFLNDPFFKQFFERGPTNHFGQEEETVQKRDISAGSGFIVSPDGLIVTNKHVVDQKGSGLEFTVILNDGKKHTAQLLAQDPILDIAVIKINASNLPVITLGDSNNIQVGQTVIAIGNALGEFSNTVSRGVISGLSRSVVARNGFSSELLSEVIQTDAAINPGNSGGPLLNLNGEVIGLNTAVAQGAQNIGFAIPINQAKKSIEDVKTIGRIIYPFLGVRYVMITPELKESENLNSDFGAFVVISGNESEASVTPGSPADIAGIKEGDIILEIDGVKITAENNLAKVIQSKKVGVVVKIKILRGNKNITLEAKLTERTQ